MGIWTWFGIGLGAKILHDISEERQRKEDLFYAECLEEIEKNEKEWKRELKRHEKEQKKLEKIKQFRREKKNQIEENRINSVFMLEPPITKEVFDNTIRKVCKKIKRIKNVYIKDAIVICEVQSQSGISDWDFSIDFNDFGALTGRYWIKSDNSKSKIPERVACLVIEELKNISPLKPDNSRLDYHEEDFDPEEYIKEEKELDEEDEKSSVIFSIIVIIILVIVFLGVVAWIDHSY